MTLLVCLGLELLASAMCSSSTNVAKMHLTELKKLTGADTCAVCIELLARPPVCCVINFS